MFAQNQHRIGIQNENYNEKNEPQTVFEREQNTHNPSTALDSKRITTNTDNSARRI